MAIPLIASSPAIDQWLVHERQRDQRQRQADRADPEPLGRRGPPGDGPGDHPGQQRAEGPAHQDHARSYRSTPASLAKATTTTSMPPNTHAQGDAGDGDGEQRAHRQSGSAVPGRFAAATGGWVPRWAARASAPTSPMTADTAMPSAGWSEVASSVTSTGPTMKTTSSSTASSAKAVFSSGDSFEPMAPAGADADAGRAEPDPDPDRGEQAHRQRPALQHADDQQRPG